MFEVGGRKTDCSDTGKDLSKAKTKTTTQTPKTPTPYKKKTKQTENPPKNPNETKQTKAIHTIEASTQRSCPKSLRVP